MRFVNYNELVYANILLYTKLVTNTPLTGLNAALFGELETEHLDKARALRSSQVQYSAGDFLYHEGDIPDKAFTLYEGWVILFKNLESGDRQILRFALPGDLLCYKTGKNRKLDHSAIAVTDVTLCAFPIDRFTQTIAELPELSFAISSVTNTVMEQCHACPNCSG